MNTEDFDNDPNVEDRTVPMTDEDLEISQALIEAAYERIGEIAVKKAKANKIASDETKAEVKIVDEETTKIDTKKHSVPCRRELDRYDGKARYYRCDTGALVHTRPMNDGERQEAFRFATDLPKSTASEAARAKSPGLKVLEGEDEADKKLGAKLQAQIDEARMGKSANPPVSEPNPPVSTETAPDDVRAAVLAADVPADLVENAITAIRDGADPATVIHNAKRAGKPEKPAKEKKPKGKSKTTQTKPLGMDEFDPQTDDTKKWEADLAAAPLSEEDRAALAASPLSTRGFQRVLKRMQAGATLTHAIEAEVEVLVEHTVSLVGEDNWRLIDDEFERADAFHLASLVEKGLPFDGALVSTRMQVKSRALDAEAEADEASA